MELSRDEVLHIATLARLGLSDEEVDRFRNQLSHILKSFEVLQEVDTTGVQPTAQPITLKNVIRDDEVSASLSQEQVLANAPGRDGDFFRIRPVLGDT
ncbi:MAG: Asp-tRNA(Asn)/Glu-tRNA(Gln) amidotransferase subunit GatC [Dehalococcoidales bacterium]